MKRHCLPPNGIVWYGYRSRNVTNRLSDSSGTSSYNLAIFGFALMGAAIDLYLISLLLIEILNIP